MNPTDSIIFYLHLVNPKTINRMSSPCNKQKVVVSSRDKQAGTSNPRNRLSGSEHPSQRLTFEATSYSKESFTLLSLGGLNQTQAFCPTWQHSFGNPSFSFESTPTLLAGVASTPKCLEEKDACAQATFYQVTSKLKTLIRFKNLFQASLAARLAKKPVSLPAALHSMPRSFAFHAKFGLLPLLPKIGSKDLRKGSTDSFLKKSQKTAHKVFSNEGFKRKLLSNFQHRILSQSFLNHFLFQLKKAESPSGAKVQKPQTRGLELNQIPITDRFSNVERETTKSSGFFQRDNHQINLTAWTPVFDFKGILPKVVCDLPRGSAFEELQLSSPITRKKEGSDQSIETAFNHLGAEPTSGETLTKKNFLYDSEATSTRTELQTLVEKQSKTFLKEFLLTSRATKASGRPRPQLGSEKVSLVTSSNLDLYHYFKPFKESATPGIFTQQAAVKYRRNNCESKKIRCGTDIPHAWSQEGLGGASHSVKFNLPITCSTFDRADFLFWKGNQEKVRNSSDRAPGSSPVVFGEPTVQAKAGSLRNKRPAKEAILEGSENKKSILNCFTSAKKEVTLASPMATQFYSAAWLLEFIRSELRSRNASIKRVLNSTFLKIQEPFTSKSLYKKEADLIETNSTSASPVRESGSTSAGALPSKNSLPIQSFLKGLRLTFSGRLGGKKGMAKTLTKTTGRVPLSTLREKVDFAKGVVHTKNGSLGVKVWICFN